MPLGYGHRIEQAILLYSSRHGRTTLDRWGELVADAMRPKRAKPFNKSTVSGWIEEMSEPALGVFVAMAKVAGGVPSWYAFGYGPGPDNPVAERTTPAKRGSARRAKENDG